MFTRAMPPGAPKKNPKPIPFQNLSVPDGGDAMKAWPRERKQNGWEWSGRCPRCNHQASKFIADEVVTLALTATEVQPVRETYVVRCNCQEPHTDRPDGEQGCGAYWGVEIEHERPDGDEEAGEAG